MALNLKAELERLYNQQQTQSNSLSERLNQIDQYSQQVAPFFRSKLSDTSNRPAGYNPVQDWQAMQEYSERNRDYRNAAAGDLASSQAQGLSLLQQLAEMQQAEADAASELSPYEKLQMELQKEAYKKQISDGTLKLNDKGELVINDNKELSPTLKQAKQLVAELLKPGNDLKSITGLFQYGMIPGTKAKNRQAQVERLRNLLSLENRQLLKGTGAISNFEAQMLERAASMLDQKLSAEDFKAELERIQKELGGPEQPQPNQKNKKGGDPLGLGL